MPSRLHSQRVGEQLMRHSELLRGQPIEAQQNPSTQVLINRMALVAYGALRHESEQSACVAKQQRLQGAAASELLDEYLASHAMHESAALHDGTAPGHGVAHEQSDAENAFPSDRCHFGRCSINRDLLHRNNRRGGKVRVAKRRIRLAQQGARGGFDGVKMRAQAAPIEDRERAQQRVSQRIMGGVRFAQHDGKVPLRD